MVLVDGVDHPGGFEAAVDVAASIPLLVKGCSSIAANSEGAKNVVVCWVATGWVSGLFSPLRTAMSRKTLGGGLWICKD